jgi:hypothetical protein
MDQKELDGIGDALANEAPIFVRGQAKKFVEKFTHADNNHDGKSDVLQLINFAEAAVPPLAALNEAIDFEKLDAHVAELSFVKDKVKLAIALKELGALAEHAGTLLPH